MVASGNSINNTVGASISGVTNTFIVTNPSNTASSSARETITVGGSSAGDPTLNFNVSGVTNFEMGIDNNDSDSFKISASTALGTTDTFVMTSAGERTLPLQPSFLAYLGTEDPTVTGDATPYTFGSGNALTEITDRGGDFATNGIFTSPVSGLYCLSGNVRFSGVGAAHTSGNAVITTSNRDWRTLTYNPFNCYGTGGGVSFSNHAFVDMDAGDTASFLLVITAGAKTVNATAGDALSWFSGFLAV